MYGKSIYFMYILPTTQLTSSTLMFSFADVSKNWMLIWSANLLASDCITTRLSGSSHLFPTEITSDK